MHAPRAAPSPADLATEVNGLSAGLAIITVALFPIAVPGLLLALLLALPVAPLALGAVFLFLLARVLVLPVRLAGVLVRRRSRDQRAAGSPARAAPAATNARP